MNSKEAIKQLVSEKISSKKVFIFSKTRCPYCVKVKQLFENHYKFCIGNNDQYDVMELDQSEHCSQIQSYLKELTGASSVPRVFINQQCIGGCDDTMKLHSNGELAKLLEK